MEWKKIEGKVHNFLEQPEVIGTLKGHKQSQFGKMDYVLDTDQGEVLVFGKTALTDLMREVEIGQEVKIVYKGKVRSKSGRDYDSFEVYTK